MFRGIVIATVMVAALALAEPACAQSQPDMSSDLANTLTHIGISVPVLTSVALTYLGNEHQERAGRQAADALLVTGLATLALKEILRRPRPNDPLADDGFPSAHAALTFAFARTISEEYDDWGKVAYLWTGGVSWSRLKRDAHTFGQVLAGAALGWYLADRSIHSRAGLCGGLIVRETPAYLHQETAAGTADPTVAVWSTTW